MSLYLIAALAVVLLIGTYLLLRDTLNRVQYLYVPFTGKYWAFYWLTRDDGGKGTSLLLKVFMLMTSEPYLKGRGMAVRIPTRKTFQIGIAHRMPYSSQEEALREVLGARELGLTVEQIAQLEGFYLSSDGVDRVGVE